MSFGNQGYAQTPGHHAEFETQESTLTWGRWEQQVYVQALLSEAAEDAGNTPTTLLRIGLALSWTTAAPNVLIPWAAAASDGSENLQGFLMEHMDVSIYGSTSKRLIYMLVGGNLKASAVVQPGQAAAGIGEGANTAAMRAACKGRFLWDDDFSA
jgi:hypothetical protein